MNELIAKLMTPKTLILYISLGFLLISLIISIVILVTSILKRKQASGFALPDLNDGKEDEPVVVNKIRKIPVIDERKAFEKLNKEETTEFYDLQNQFVKDISQKAKMKKVILPKIEEKKEPIPVESQFIDTEEEIIDEFDALLMELGQE